MSTPGHLTGFLDRPLEVRVVKAVKGEYASHGYIYSFKEQGLRRSS